MKKKGIIIVGTGSTGLTAAVELAAKQNNICVLNSVLDDEFTDLKEPKPYLITRLPEMPEMPEIWIDPNLPKFNENKFNRTCLKNRKKRKNRKNS